MVLRVFLGDGIHQKLNYNLVQERMRRGRGATALVTPGKCFYRLLLCVVPIWGEPSCVEGSKSLSRFMRGCEVCLVDDSLGKSGGGSSDWGYDIISKGRSVNDEGFWGSSDGFSLSSCRYLIKLFPRSTTREKQSNSVKIRRGQRFRGIRGGSSQQIHGLPDYGLPGEGTSSIDWDETIAYVEKMARSTLGTVPKKPIIYPYDITRRNLLRLWRGTIWEHTWGATVNNSILCLLACLTCQHLETR